MSFFTPHLQILPLAQQRVWQELYATPDHFTLYGGTALALHLGHRKSVDFDFFSSEPFEAESLMRSIPYLRGAERLDVSKNSLTCRVERGGYVKMQFFGGLPLGRVEPRQQPIDAGFWVASLLDVAGSKDKVLPERSEAKDYIDLDALLRNGVDLPTMLAAAQAIYGHGYNPILSLKAMTYFGDVSELEEDVKKRLSEAAVHVDISKLPELVPIQPYGMEGDIL